MAVAALTLRSGLSIWLAHGDDKGIAFWRKSFEGDLGVLRWL